MGAAQAFRWVIDHPRRPWHQDCKENENALLGAFFLHLTHVLRSNLNIKVLKESFEIGLVRPRVT